MGKRKVVSRVGQTRPGFLILAAWTENVHAQKDRAGRDVVDAQGFSQRFPGDPIVELVYEEALRRQKRALADVQHFVRLTRRVVKLQETAKP